MSTQTTTQLIDRFVQVRGLTESLAAPLEPEDQVVQSMPDVSPTKWHRAHVTWFFETFLLTARAPGYTPFDDRFGYLFNSYYQQVGDRHPRPQRGLLSRPTVSEVGRYRAHVDAAMIDLLDAAGNEDSELAALVDLGLHHEQQHQELLLMDIKHVFSVNPIRPAYRPAVGTVGAAAAPSSWVSFDGGLAEIGRPSGGPGFGFDNESSRHTVYLQGFELADRLVTNGEWLQFMADGGYRRPELWLSDGWNAVLGERWEAPLYWERRDGDWQVFTLSGLQPVRLDEPVGHVSHYEADAYARWAGARLPTEAEWEVAAVAAGADLEGNLLETGNLHPVPAPAGTGLRQMFGDVWEWTASAYLPYPGFTTAPGAVGEYNGKFMSNQMVLRGGCAATPPGHIRPTYRNFFPPHARWAFSGLRLAKSAF